MRTSKDILKDMRSIGVVVRGSLVQAERTCGNKRCKCARGELHTAFYLSRSIKGKTKMEHVSRDDVERVKEWSLNHAKLTELVEELTGAVIRELREARKKRRESKE
jgi:hypothetical protein